MTNLGPCQYKKDITKMKCAAKGNWNGVYGIQGENDSGLLQAKGLMDLTDVFSSSVGGYRVQVIGVSVGFGF